MTVCVWCQRPLKTSLTLAQFWRWGPVTPPDICAPCQGRLSPISGQHCPQCGRQQTTCQLCQDCQRWDQPLVNRALYCYDAEMKAYMQQYKFQGDYALRRVLQRALATALTQLTYDILVPVPIAQSTWQSRGFNQVTGWLTGQAYYQVLQVIDQDKATPQSAKNRTQRLLTPQPFTLAPQAKDLCHGQRVLLLDDVYTTGRTLRHAATQINLTGAKAVTSLTLAR
ncbi:phosphoribosyltransferase [Levilactobacillus brevis]|uniref:ComF family protein n=1 Tax=Levilactobacillus brevis TaxID=1580 RepID=UPI0011425E98|nr:ComF family protein [Levilactobacillus brevis]GEA98189.1 phosphoribosyltransferase [Levilactobacillus brevis]